MKHVFLLIPVIIVVVCFTSDVVARRPVMRRMRRNKGTTSFITEAPTTTRTAGTTASRSGGIIIPFHFQKPFVITTGIDYGTSFNNYKAQKMKTNTEQPENLSNSTNINNSTEVVDGSTGTNSPDDSTSIKYLLPPPAIIVTVAVLAVLLISFIILGIYCIYKKRPKVGPVVRQSELVDEFPEFQAPPRPTSLSLEPHHPIPSLSTSQSTSKRQSSSGAHGSQVAPKTFEENGQDLEALPSISTTKSDDVLQNTLPTEPSQLPKLDTEYSTASQPGPTTSKPRVSNNETDSQYVRNSPIHSDPNPAQHVEDLQISSTSVAPSTDICIGPLHEHLDDLQYDSSKYEFDIGNLEILKHLGGGNFGFIHEGILSLPQSRRSLRPKKKMDVIMKSPGNGKNLSEGEIKIRKEIFYKELKLMCAVGPHPNLVLLIGAVTQNTEVTYIIMQKCELGDLKSFLGSPTRLFIPQFDCKLNQYQLDKYGYLQPDGTVRPMQKFLPVKYVQVENNSKWRPDLSKGISTAHLFSFAMQIAEGMEYLKSKKCVHRDLAARNILLTPSGLCKIADFGLAKRLVYKDYYRINTMHELPLKWLAIESIKSMGGKFTFQSDIWSYGIVLHEIFTIGGAPYPSASSPKEAEDAVIKGERNKQSDYCPDLIFRHMERCWSVDPNQRPPFAESAELMRRHLDAASKEVHQTVIEERRRETKRQRELELLRYESLRSSSSSDTSPTSQRRSVE